MRNHIPGWPITGKHFVAPCGLCDVPPWLPCACSALLATDASGASERLNAEAELRFALAVEND